MAVRWLDLVDPTREQLVDALEVHVASEVLEMLLAAPVERPRPHLEGHGEYVFGDGRGTVGSRPSRDALGRSGFGR